MYKQELAISMIRQGRVILKLHWASNTQKRGLTCAGRRPQTIGLFHGR